MIKIFDIPISDLKEDEILKLIEEHLKPHQRKLFIVTPNPEILLASLRNDKLSHLLKTDSFNIPDGAGLLWANYYLQKTANKSQFLKLLFAPISLIIFAFNKKVLPANFNLVVTGTDLMKSICLDQKLSKEPIFLLGGFFPEIPATVKSNFLKLNPRLNIVATSTTNPDDLSSIQEINSSEAKILFVAYGGSPLKQELWIAENLPKLTHIKIAIGVGGAFDYHAGKVKRAPLLLRKIGLEWLIRLFHQPKRISRILRAVVVFPYKVIQLNLKYPRR